MNKRFLNTLFIFFLAILFIILIAPQVNSSPPDDSNGVSNNPENVEDNPASPPTGEYSEDSGELENEIEIGDSEDKFESDDSKNESFSNEKFEYINLSDISKENSQKDSENTEEKEENPEINLGTDYCLLYSHSPNGEKKVEVINCIEEDWKFLSENLKPIQDIKKNEFEKEVIISSEEHFEKELRIYIDLTQESEKKDIRIYWENQEGIDITLFDEYGVEYYDEDDNGLIEKVSWIVPHLSEQIFRVVIELNNINNSEEEGSEEESLLLNVSGPIGNVRNPILFNISVNYSKEFICNLQVGGIGENFEEIFNSNESYNLNLPNGDYDWGVVCLDPSNKSVTNASLGSFSINETFNSSLKEGKLYFLDLTQNKILNSETIIINSSAPSNFSVQIIKGENNIIYSRNYANSASFIMNESILKGDGNYALKIIFDEPAPNYTLLTNFSVASANLSLNATSIKKDGSVKVTANITSPFKNITHVILDYGDGNSNITYLDINTLQFNKIFTRKYTQEGNYTLKLNMIMGGENFIIQKNGLNVIEQSELNVTGQTNKDKSAPDITLLKPYSKQIIYVNSINFTYRASDDVKIKNCSLRIYNGCSSLTHCTWNKSNLVFPLTSKDKSVANNDSVQNNKNVVVMLTDFEEGIYLWEVECFDNSSNEYLNASIFQVILNNVTNNSDLYYDSKEEVDKLKELADKVLTSNYSLKEKEVLEKLNILEETKYYKKRLLDIQNFFQENYKYVGSESLRKKKTEDYLNELESIRTKIPLNVKVNKDYEYVKNSISGDFKQIIEEYFSSTNTILKGASLRKSVEINKKMQNDISVSSEAMEVEIEYANGTQKFILVTKKVKIGENSRGSILEFIPESLFKNKENIVFITDSERKGKGNLFEIEQEDIKNNEIIYYISESVKLKDIEDTETMLFEDDLTNIKTRVTGYFVLGGLSGGLTIYIVILFMFLVVLFTIAPIVFKKFKMRGWKKEPNVARVIDLIKEINKSLKEKDIEGARAKYYKIKEIYPVLPYKTRNYFYKEINDVLIKIDKKDIYGLVEEYQEAKSRWDRETIMRLYKDIKKIYKRLPEKDRKKIYDIINGY